MLPDADLVLNGRVVTLLPSFQSVSQQSHKNNAHLVPSLARDDSGLVLSLDGLLTQRLEQTDEQRTTKTQITHAALSVLLVHIAGGPK